jgi:hypothetical protein
MLMAANYKCWQSFLESKFVPCGGIDCFEEIIRFMLGCCFGFVDFFNVCYKR